jgi:hypothetical protein
MEMAESASLIRSESARRYVDGRMGRWGVVMLYPDRLAIGSLRTDRTTRLNGQFAVETLAGLGREVRATPLSLAVTPQAVSNGA